MTSRAFSNSPLPRLPGQCQPFFSHQYLQLSGHFSQFVMYWDFSWLCPNIINYSYNKMLEKTIFTNPLQSCKQSYVKVQSEFYEIISWHFITIIRCGSGIHKSTGSSQHTFSSALGESVQPRIQWRLPVSGAQALHAPHRAPLTQQGPKHSRTLQDQGVLSRVIKWDLWENLVEMCVCSLNLNL